MVKGKMCFLPDFSLKTILCRVVVYFVEFLLLLAEYVCRPKPHFMLKIMYTRLFFEILSLGDVFSKSHRAGQPKKTYGRGFVFVFVRFVWVFFSSEKSGNMYIILSSTFVAF
jgi:hypothetical protein